MIKKLLGKISVIKVLVLTGIFVLIGAGYGWWRMVYSNPVNVFNRMLATSLSSNSVTRAVKQDDGAQILDQVSQFSVSPNMRVHGTNDLTQITDAGTVVTTENIATPTVDFVRYTDIKTSQKNTSGKSFDFSSVIGIWGKADSEDPLSGGAQLFNQNLFSVMPVANLPAAQRKEIVSLIKTSKVFETDFTKVEKSIRGGRPVYSYQVAINPQAYVAMLKVFARDMGLTQLEQVDPSQYADSEPLRFTFGIDVWSGQLRTIEYQDSKRTEQISAYGAQLLIPLPTETVTLDKLQTKLQGIQ